MDSFEIQLESPPSGSREYRFEIPEEQVRAEFAERGCNDLGVRGPVSAVVQLKSAAGETVLTGRVEGTLSLSCVRCLADFTAPVAREFAVKVVREGEKTAAGAGGDHVDVEDVEVVTGERLDVAGILYDQLILAVPEYPLCSAGCRGLCPECGVDLNRESCGCAGKTRVDPRLAALAKLKR